MIEVLPDSEIEQLLFEEFVGRIGCSADGKTYVIPVAYAYHNGAVYSHSIEGVKLRTMRKNPNVCFEVDRVTDELNWRSVVAWGTFQELRGEAAEDAKRIILLKFLMAKAREPVTAPAGRPGVVNGGVVYRIRLTERTGRFRQTSPPLHRFFQAEA